MAGSEDSYAVIAVTMFAASVEWIPSQKTYSVLFWHGVRPGSQTPCSFVGQQLSSVTVKPEIQEPQQCYYCTIIKVRHSSSVSI